MFENVKDFLEDIPILTSVALAEGEAFLVNLKERSKDYAFIEWVNNPDMPKPFEITTEKTSKGIRSTCKMTIWKMR